MPIIREADIGGAEVKRHFNGAAGKQFSPRDRLTREDVLAIPVNNRVALIDNGYIVVFPPDDAAHAAAEQMHGDVFFISRGFGKYDMIRGKKLNSEPLSQEQAVALGYVVPVDKKSKKKSPPAN